MILLENNNRILEDALTERINAAKPEAFDISFADFDGVEFHVSATRDTPNIVNISIRFKGAQQVMKEFGGAELLKRYYGPLFQSTPESGYEATIQLDLAKLPAGKDELPGKIGYLKRHLYAAPFLQAMEKKPADVIVFRYRPEESCYIKAEPDRVTVIFEVLFRDTDDIIFGKVFLQMFADVRREAAMNRAPAVSFSQKEPPLELKGVKGVKAGENNGFVSFVLFSHHMTDAGRDRTLDLIQTFRDYFHYHIKCSKAYMHTCMRVRVESLLQILNRARPPPLDDTKRTAQGKTFKRAGQ